MFMKRFSKKWIIMIAVNLLIVILSLVRFHWACTHLPAVDSEKINTETWRGRNVEFRDGGFFVDQSIMDNGQITDFLWGPYEPLKKGSYTADITYEAESSQKCFVGFDSNGGEYPFYDSSIGILSSLADHARYQFEITKDVEELLLVIQYSGKGDFGIRSISIVPNNNLAKREFVQTLLFLLLVDLVVLTGRLPNKQKKIALILVGITSLVSIPIAVKGVFLGHDLEFHMLRIESIVDALRSGQFPARISTLALWGLGYPFSIYYNDIFLYFPAILRLFGFSVTTAYKMYLLFVNILTVLIAYYSFRKITASQETGLVLTLLYSATAYRFTNLYVRSAVGEYTAQAFLPLLALALYNMYGGSEEERSRVLRNAVLMTAALTGIIGSHILTLLVAGFLMVLIALILWRRTFSKTVLLTYVAAFILTVGVNLYFIVPFADYFLNVPTYIGNSVREQTPMIQKSGIYPGHLFSFFQGVMGQATSTTNGRLQLTPGLPLMAVCMFAVYFRLFSGKKKHSDFLLLFSLLLLFSSTDIFPWDWLSKHLVLVRLLAQIQFPWRLLTFAVLFMTLLAGEVLEMDRFPHARTAAVCTSILMSIWFASNLFSYDNYTYFYDTQSLNLGKTGPEYLLADTSINNYNTELQLSGMKDVYVISKSSNRILFNCTVSARSEEHWVTIPVFNYKGYHVIGIDGQEFVVENGEQNHISFQLPDSYSGPVSVEYRDPPYWTAALYASVVIFLLLAAICLGKFGYFRIQRKI